MAAQPNEVRRSNFFISQSPSDDEEFPYWTPTDYLERKFARTNAQVWELVRSRQCVDTYTRNPALDRKLMEAVEMFGSEPENLQRTATKRSGDITVYSLLAQRCWRDVAKHIGTGVTPRQCEERYLQLIAASKRFDEQNIENGLVKVPLRAQQPYIVPTLPRNKARATKSISDSNFDSINDLVQQDMHSSQRTYKGPNLHKRKLYYQGTASSLPFDAYDMEIDDDHAREVTKLKKQYARLAQTQDVPTQPAPAKFTKQVTEVAKVRPARPVDNVNIYKKHYIADALAHTLLSPKRTSAAISKQSTTTVNPATTENAAPKRKYNVNKYKGKVFTRRKDAADSDFESFDSWKSDDLRTDDSAFDTSSSSDYYSSDDDTKPASSEKISNNNSSTESAADASTSTGQEIASTVRDVLASIVNKLESAFAVTTTVSTGTICTPILAILPPAEPSVADEGYDLSDSDLESAYSSSSSRAGDANNYHNSNIMYNYEFFEEQSADSSDLDDIGSVESLCSVSSNSTTTDYTPFIDPAIFKYDDTDFYANETAMNTTLNNTMQNRNVGAVQQSLTEKSDNVADILAEIVDTIVARNRPSPTVTSANWKLPTGTSKTVRHSNFTTTSAPITHTKLFKNNHDTTPTAPVFSLPPLPPADEALLKSLLPTRRYRKKDINWKFLALLVGRKGSEIRAYAAQWRYEKRVELLNKLITLRQHSTKKKSKRKVRTVRRPKKTENPKKFTPSNPSKPPGEKKNAVKVGSSALTLPTALIHNSPSQTGLSGDNPTNSATLTLHEMPPPSLHPVFDHTLLRAFLNVPGATRSAVGTGGTTVTGEEVRAEFHTEPVEHSSQKDNHQNSEGSYIVSDGDRIDTTNSDDPSDAVDVDKGDDGPEAAKSANIIPNEAGNTTVTVDTTTTNANVNTDPISRELISETLNITENEIEVAEILTQSRGSVDLTGTDGPQIELHNQNVLPLDKAPTVIVTPVTPVVPAVPISTIAATDSIQEKPSENGHIAPPDDATDLQLVKSMLLATTCNKTWAEVSKVTNLSEETAAYCLQRYQQIQQHYPQYIDSVAVKVYLNNKVKRDTKLVEAMQKQSELTEQEQQLLQAVYLCHTGQLPILHAYLTNPLFNQIGVLCGTLCNWQYDAISAYLRWGRAQCQSRYAKLFREYKQKYPNATAATPAATPATADSVGSVPTNVDFAKAASYLSAPSSHFFSGANSTAPGISAGAVTPGGDTNNPVQRPPSPLPRLPVPQFTAEKESLLMDLIARASSKLTPFVFTHAHSIPQKDRVKYLLDWLGEETWDAIALYVGIARRNCIDKYYTLFQAQLRAEMDRKVSVQRPSSAAPAQSISSSNNSGTSTQLSTGSSATPTTTTTHTSKPISNTKNISSDKNIVKNVSTTPRADLLYCHERLYYNEFSYPWSGSHGVNARELLVVSSKAMRIDPWTAADARLCKAQALYAAVLGKMKRGESLDAEMKADLRTTLETHFSNAIPTSSFYFEGRNRSEDDWLVRLVWIQAASAAKKTAPPKPPMTAITSNTTIHTDTVQSTTISATATAPATATPSVPESTAAALSAPSIATPSISFDPTNPISAVRLILPLSAWNIIALRLGRSIEWCQDRYFLLLQAKLSNSYPATASQKLAFEYPSLKIGASDTIASVSTSVTKKPRLKAVLHTVPSNSQSHTQPQASGHNTTSTAGDGTSTGNASASVLGSTVPPSATVGVKRKKNSDATTAKTKIQKAVYPELSGPSSAHPMITSTSQSSIISMQSTSAYSSSVDLARDTMPSNHAFSTGFHHYSSSGNNSTLSNPMANNSTGVTMGIMASIPTMAEYEISSNNGSNEG